MDDRELCRLALKARKRAYAPYSRFAVGAALLCGDGGVYLGGNIENAAYSPTNCAERTAFFTAVSEGKREFAAIAIAGGPAEGAAARACPPCGVCLQVMMEFCSPGTFRVLLAKNDGSFESFSLQELLPKGFGPERINPAQITEGSGHGEKNQ